MDLSLKNMYIIISIVVVILGGLIFWNYQVGQLVLEERAALNRAATLRPTRRVTRHGPVSSPKQTVTMPRTHTLTPQDPAKFGMTVHPENETPQTQAQWHMYIATTIEKKGLLETPEGKAILESIKTPQAEFETNVAKMEEQISLMENRLHENPLDTEAAAMLENLYQLKALAAVMKDKVMIPGPPAPEPIVPEATVPTVVIPADAPLPAAPDEKTADTTAAETPVIK